MERIKNILSDILSIASPSGGERLLAHKFATYMESLVDDVTTDALGNVIALK